MDILETIRFIAQIPDYLYEQIEEEIDVQIPEEIADKGYTEHDIEERGFELLVTVKVREKKK